MTTCVTTLHYPAGTKGQRVLAETETCAHESDGERKCTTTYAYSNQATARTKKVIGIAMVHGRVQEVAHGFTAHRRLKLSLSKLPRGRYNVTLVVPRRARVFVQVGRIWVRVP